MMQKELDAIRERAEKATPGPWWLGGNDVDGPDTGYGELRVATISNTARREQKANAEFIAHAREDIPRLLAEIERLQAELKYYKYALGVEDDE